MIDDLTATRCRQLADDYKSRARDPGISQKRMALLSNIARSFNGLASQLDMLAADVAEKS